MGRGEAPLWGVEGLLGPRSLPPTSNGTEGPVTALPHLGHCTEAWAYSVLLSSTAHRCSEIQISPVKAGLVRASGPCSNTRTVDTLEWPAMGLRACLLLHWEVCHRHCLPSDGSPAWFCVEIGSGLSSSPGLRPGPEPGSRSPLEPFSVCPSLPRSLHQLPAGQGFALCTRRVIMSGVSSFTAARVC